MSEKPPLGELLAERYELRGELGESPSRVAYRAFDREVEVEVALWWLRPELFPSEDRRQRIEDALDKMRTCRDPHLLRPFSSGRTGDPESVFVTLQLGTTSRLEGLLGEERPVSQEEMLLYAQGLARAVEAVHHRGFYHGWMAPADVVEVAGLIKLAGCGIYPAMDPAEALQVWGSDQRYLAPEVLAGAAEPGSDWYSVAAIVLDLCVGRIGATLQDSQHALQMLSPERYAALAGALSRDPGDRPRTADEFLGRIYDAWGGRPDAQGRVPSVIGESGTGGEVGVLSFLDDEEDEMTLVHSGRVDWAAYRGDTEVTPMSEEASSPAPRAASPAPDVPASDVPAPDVPASPPEERTALPKVPTPLPEDDATIVDAPAEVKLEMVSMREPLAPAPPAVHEPPARPVLRPLSSLAGAAEHKPELGRLAPPSSQRRRPTTWPWILASLLAGAVIVAGGVYIARALGGGASEESPPPSASAASPDRVAPAPQASGETPPPDVRSAAPSPAQCPADMSYVAAADTCIESYESPGAGRMPETGLSLEVAEARCASRQRRLCSAAEWEPACRRNGTQSWPYGDLFQPEICNLQGEVIVAAGARSACQNSLGIHDMSGNTAEWVAEGEIRGGSALDGTEGRCSQLRPRPKRQEAYSDVGFRCCADPVASRSGSD